MLYGLFTTQVEVQLLLLLAFLENQATWRRSKWFILNKDTDA